MRSQLTGAIRRRQCDRNRPRRASLTLEVGTLPGAMDTQRSAQRPGQPTAPSHILQSCQRGPRSVSACRTSRSPRLARVLGPNVAQPEARTCARPERSELGRTGRDEVPASLVGMGGSPRAPSPWPGDAPQMSLKSPYLVPQCTTPLWCSTLKYRPTL